jgi:chemotaxis protein methyltransferase CheR
MTETFPTALLSSLSDFLVAKMGLHFPPNRAADLEWGIRAAAKEFGFNDHEACVEWLLSSSPTKHQIETLASQLTVGETYFFREKPTFQAMEEQVLPDIIRRHASDRRLRIWSAGCATGEEPFSLAILVSKVIPNLDEWNVSILGTDINPRSLQKASAGAYTTWSFRDCPPGISQTYFKNIDESRLEIRPDIRKMVTFSYLNLVEDLYPSLLNETNALDVIFCRNVLMYFGSEQVKRVIQRFHRCLLDGSWLVVSATETSHLHYSQFSTVNFPGAILYRKDRQPLRAFDLQTLKSYQEPSPPLQPTSALEAQPIAPEMTFPPPSETTPPDIVFPPLEEPPPAPSSDPSALYEDGRYAEATEAAAALLSDKPDDIKAMALQARILANQGLLAQALEWCDKAIAAERLDPALHYLRATILQEQGGTGEAVNSLKRAIYLDHRFVLAHFALGNLHRLLGKSREADKHFQNVLSSLKEYRQEEILPESEGITAGRLREIIETLSTAEA